MMMEATKPASRILALLELLQDHPGMSGPRLAEELGVTTRTIRRYVITLQDMGIPVEPMAGRTGGYWLRPGFRLPPLMFRPDEAIGLVIALLSTRTGDGEDLPQPVQQALAKIERVLPKELVERIAQIRSTMQVPELGYRSDQAFPNPNVLATLAQATLTTTRCWLRYGRPDGEESAREVDCYGIVVHHGRWYLHGYCHLRQDARTFRIDRIRRVDLLETTFTPPDQLDVRAAVMASLALVRSDYQVEIVIDAPIERVRMQISPDLAVLEPIGEGQTRLLSSTESLDWFAWRMSAVPFPMQVIEPRDLAETFRRFGDRMHAIAEVSLPPRVPSS